MAFESVIDGKKTLSTTQIVFKDYFDLFGTDEAEPRRLLKICNNFLEQAEIAGIYRLVSINNEEVYGHKLLQETTDAEQKADAFIVEIRASRSYKREKAKASLNLLIADIEGRLERLRALKIQLLDVSKNPDRDGLKVPDLERVLDAELEGLQNALSDNQSDFRELEELTQVLQIEKEARLRAEKELKVLKSKTQGDYARSQRLRARSGNEEQHTDNEKQQTNTNVSSRSCNIF